MFRVRCTSLAVTIVATLCAQLAGAQPAPETPPPVVPAAAPAPPAQPAASEAPANPAQAAVAEKPAEPFAFGDFTWLNGANRQKAALLDSKYFTGSFLFDANYTESNHHPIDNTVVGSTALARNSELQISFMGFGGDFHYESARARLMTQFGTRSTIVPRNDTSADRGQFQLRDVYRYISEANAGYHFDVWHGINVDVGIFMSYVGLFSYDNFENWGYQPSFTSDNTPWFFNGVRVQTFPTERLKVELWLINGWQSYGKFNEMPGIGGQIMYRPVESVAMLSNNYMGTDTAGAPGRMRFHTDDSFLLRYHDAPGSFLRRAAFSVTADLGIETGDGVVGFGGTGSEGHCTSATPCDQNFISAMAYNRLWLGASEKFAWTIGGGFMHNPGRYLVLMPTGVAGQQFDMSAGSAFDGWDGSTTFDWMPDQFQTWRLEFVHRAASIPYFAGHGGVTSSTGYIGGSTTNWKPDLVKDESRVIAALLFRM